MPSPWDVPSVKGRPRRVPLGTEELSWPHFASVSIATDRHGIVLTTSFVPVLGISPRPARVCAVTSQKLCETLTQQEGYNGYGSRQAIPLAALAIRWRVLICIDMVSFAPA